MTKGFTGSRTVRSRIATMRRTISDMQKLRDKFIASDQVAPDMIHFDASVAIAKVLLGKIELERLDDVTFKDTLEMHGLLSSGMYPEEDILRFYGINDSGRTIDYFYSTLYRVPEILAVAKEERK